MDAMSQADYDRGFADGLKFCARCIRNAALLVEGTTYSDFTGKPDEYGVTGKTFRAIAKSGQPHFAAQLRAVADEIERAITEAPHGSAI